MRIVCALTAVLVVLQTVVDGCTMIAIGRNATIDGAAMIAHTDDAGGGAADVRIVLVPAMDHPPGSQRAVYEFFGGYPRLVTEERGPGYAPAEGQVVTTPLGYIPQVDHTYAYFDQDYGMINEHQLSIAESTCGARTVGWPLDQPQGRNMFGIAELSKVALERCDSARCAIHTMGDLAVEYGFYSEDSGDPNDPGYVDSAEALSIADKYGEAWVFHVLTGPDNSSAVWAAQRVPDDEVAVVANGFMIREMDLDDKDMFMASDNVVSFAKEMGWWHKDLGPIDFTAAYGFVDFNPIRPLYTGRRVWRVFDMLAPSLHLDSRLGLFTQYETYPFSVKPEEKVNVERVSNILRDYYQGTEYDLSKGLAAGPFGAPVRFEGNADGVVGGWERPISIFRTIYSFVTQSRGSMDDAIGGVIWYGQSSPHGTVYTPFSCQQDAVPDVYVMGEQSSFDFQSAWRAFNFVNNWSLLRFNAIHADVRNKIDVLQQEAFDTHRESEKQALMMEPEAALEYLQSTRNAFAESLVARWWQFAWKLVAKYSDGYITTGEATKEMGTPGYPAWWLRLTSFSSWPGDTIKPKECIKDDFMMFNPPEEDVRKHRTSGWYWDIGAGISAGLVVGAALMAFSQRYRRDGYQSLP